MHLGQTIEEAMPQFGLDPASGVVKRITRVIAGGVYEIPKPQCPIKPTIQTGVDLRTDEVQIEVHRLSECVFIP